MKRLLLLLFVTFFATFTSIAPAEAYAREWDNAARSSAPPLNSDSTVPAHDWRHQPQCHGVSATTVIRLDGDFVYVKDVCRDGKSAVGAWRISEGKQAGRHGICRNSHGDGTWARCNKEWPEGQQQMMFLAAGEYDGDTGSLHVDWGSSIWFMGA